MSHSLGLVFAKSGTDVDDLFERYLIDTEGYYEDEEEGEDCCDGYYDGCLETNILYTKDGSKVGHAKVSDVDWDKTGKELDYLNRPDGWKQLESITEDEDGWTEADDYLVEKEEIPEGQSGWITYVKKYAAKLLEEDADAVVYGMDYHI